MFGAVGIQDQQGTGPSGEDDPAIGGYGRGGADVRASVVGPYLGAIRRRKRIQHTVARRDEQLAAVGEQRRGIYGYRQSESPDGFRQLALPQLMAFGVQSADDTVVRSDVDRALGVNDRPGSKGGLGQEIPRQLGVYRPRYCGAAGVASVVLVHRPRAGRQAGRQGRAG